MIKQYTTPIIALLVLVAGFSLHSCSDVLNQAPMERSPSRRFFKTMKR